MYVKSLTLKGFKSFASATNLVLEPGITCIVGPNGSGKSNVVDALAWVMGEQGAKSLRGGKMEDVIFAGTPNRPPLGRAEVTLTIDNTDGALPIDYTEVTITRTLFRGGGSEYQINGTAVRLLDVAELPLTVMGDIPAKRLSTGANIVSGAAYDAIDADMVDMETFALLRACMMFDVPLVGLRGISDGADDLHHFDDWTQYLHVIDEKLAGAVDRIEAAIESGAAFA